MSGFAEGQTHTNLQSMKNQIQRFLSRLSFRTGVIVLAMCIPFYVISFAQAALPTSVATKGILWFVFFGLAKTCQYAGLAILGVEGWQRLKKFFRTRKNTASEK